MDELTDVLYEVEDGLATITINRPERLNAFRARTVDELIHCFKRAWASGDVGVVCLTGAGERAFCTGGDQKHYSVGDRLVTRDIRGVRIGLAICYDICWPQLYIGYREKGVTVMIHSFHNARSKGANCLDTLNVHQVPTRCADNRMWAVCNNSSQPYSHWGSFIARPDATIPKQLAINQPGMLIHDFPDGLSAGGWYHNFKPMQKREDEIMSWGTPIKHPRQSDGQAEP